MVGIDAMTGLYDVRRNIRQEDRGQGQHGGAACVACGCHELATGDQ